MLTIFRFITRYLGISFACNRIQPRSAPLVSLTGIFLASSLSQSAPLAATNDRQSMAAGYTHTCAIQDEKLYCWGGNDNGQLGLGHKESASGAKWVSALPGRVLQVSTLESHTCAITTDGLYCWGKNSFGALGTGDRISRSLPEKVMGLPEGAEVSFVSTGDHHTCAVVNAGLMCWGWNRSCVLGKPHCVGGNDSNGDFETRPKWVTGLGPDSGVSSVAAGETHTCAVVQNGLRCWGWNLFGKLGYGYKDQEYTALPTWVKGMNVGGQVSEVSVSNHVSCAKNFDRVRCWGRDPLVGRGNIDNGQTPQLIAVLTHQDRPSQLSSNGTNTCLINFGQKILCFGFNTFGQLAHPDTWNINTLPQYIQGLPDNVSWRTVKNGHAHACALSSQGEVWCWGWNAHCQMGSGSCSGRADDMQFSPQKVVGL